MNGRVRAVLRKELREFRRNKLVIGTMVAILPVFSGMWLREFHFDEHPGVADRFLAWSCLLRRK